MKNYFVKYLPVEGETKPRDKFNSVAGELPGSQHVRLFICSRDIKVSDHFFYEGSENDPDFKEGLTNNGEEGLLDGNCYKIIGEISPEAIWIKEGDEFDESDIKKYIIALDGLPVLPFHWGLELQSKDPNRYKDAFKFKCPTCKTFH